MRTDVRLGLEISLWLSFGVFSLMNDLDLTFGHFFPTFYTLIGFPALLKNCFHDGLSPATCTPGQLGCTTTSLPDPAQASTSSNVSSGVFQPRYPPIPNRREYGLSGWGTMWTTMFPTPGEGPAKTGSPSEVKHTGGKRGLCMNGQPRQIA